MLFSKELDRYMKTGRLNGDEKPVQVVELLLGVKKLKDQVENELDEMIVYFIDGVIDCDEDDVAELVELLQETYTRRMRYFDLVDLLGDRGYDISWLYDKDSMEGFKCELNGVQGYLLYDFIRTHLNVENDDRFIEYLMIQLEAHFNF